MKNSAIKKACAVLSILLGSSVWAVSQDRDELNRSFTLPARARVEVSAFSGTVDVEAIDGDTAIVQIERTGRSGAELECNKITLEQVSNNLIVQTRNRGGEGCQTNVVARVLLKLPRHVSLSVQGVSGPINIGEIEGALRISGNSGKINLAQAGSGSRITGNSGTTTIKLRKLDDGGLELSGNSG